MVKAKILLAEDDGLLAVNIKARLEILDYSLVEIVTSREEVIKNTLETKPDLVLMDIGLAGEIDGIEAARQILRQLFIPIVYLTAYSGDETISRAKVTEPYGYITKPFDITNLATSIELAKMREAPRRPERRRWDG